MINLRELSGTGWPAVIRAWQCQPTREPMGCDEPLGLAQPQLLSVSPIALGCSRQLPRAGSKWSRASQSLPAQRAAGTRMAPWPRDTAPASDGQNRQLLALLEPVLPAQSGWEQLVTASTEIS